MVVDHSIFTIQGEISWRWRKSLQRAGSYCRNKASSALFLSHTTLRVWPWPCCWLKQFSLCGRERSLGAYPVFFFRMNHESSFDGLLHGRGRPPRLPRQGSQGPDLSHLTPEERTIIEGVMQKQQVRVKFTTDSDDLVRNLRHSKEGSQSRF